MVKTSTLAIILAALIISVVFAQEADAAGLVWRAINKAGSILNDIGSPTSSYSFSNQRLTSLGTPTAATDAARANTLQIGKTLVTSVCPDGSPLEYQTSNSTWICGIDSAGGITSINGDSTVTQVFSGTANNMTITDTGAGTLQFNLASNVVTTGDSAQTITKALTINSGTLGGNLNANTFTINNWNVATVTGATTLTTSNEVVLLNPSTTAFTVTLPDATGNTGKHYRFHYVATTGTQVIIDGQASDTINGQLSVALKYPYTIYDMYSDGTNWFAVYNDLIYSRENNVVLVDEFQSSIGTSTVVGAQGMLGWTDTGTGTETALYVDGETGHMGIKRLGTTATSGDDNFLFLASTTILNTFDPDDTFDLTYIVRPITAITSVNYAVGANLNPVTATYLTSENAMFLFDSAGTNTGGDTTHWVCRTRSSGGTDQTTATTITVTLNQWYNLRILKDSGTIRFLIDDVNVCNHSTQIPTNPLSPFVAIDTLSAAARTMDIDYFKGSFVMSGR